VVFPFPARAGYAIERLMIYATGGLAVAEIESKHRTFSSGLSAFFLVTNFPITDYAGSSSKTRVGWVVAAGLDTRSLNNWFGQEGEYLSRTSTLAHGHTSLLLRMPYPVRCWPP